MALYRHVASGTFPGEQWSFTMHTSGTASLTAAQAGWVAAMNTFWTDNFDAHVAANVVLTELDTSSIDEATEGQLSRLSASVNLAGAATGISLPPQVATCVTWTSAFQNRHGYGRIYLPPLASTSMAAGRISAAAAGGISDAAEGLVNGLNGGGLAPVIRNRTGHISTTITGGYVDDVFDTQRRRRNKLIGTKYPFTIPAG